MADDFDLPLMIHVQETRMQVVTGQLFYGSTMVEYLDRIGFGEAEDRLHPRHLAEPARDRDPRPHRGQHPAQPALEPPRSAPGWRRCAPCSMPG